jgi:hypothetical protein
LKYLFPDVTPVFCHRAVAGFILTILTLPPGIALLQYAGIAIHCFNNSKPKIPWAHFFRTFSNLQIGNIKIWHISTIIPNIFYYCNIII